MCAISSVVFVEMTRPSIYNIYNKFRMCQNLSFFLACKERLIE